MSSHPGAGLREAIELAEFLRDMGYHPEQVQDFIPTPGSLSTCMYYSGINPLTSEPVYVAKDPHEKRLQRALMQYRDPKNREMVYEALTKANRTDLIGFGPKCLIRPRDGEAVTRHSLPQAKNRRLPSARGPAAKPIKGVTKTREAKPKRGRGKV